MYFRCLRIFGLKRQRKGNEASLSEMKHLLKIWVRFLKSFRTGANGKPSFTQQSTLRSKSR